MLTTAQEDPNNWLMVTGNYTGKIVLTFSKLNGAIMQQEVIAKGRVN